MIGRIVRMTVAAALATAIVGVTPALANDADVIREGNCSGASDWKLKLSPENGRIEVEYEVDQNVNGDKWRVVLRHNGVKVADVVRTPKPPSGSFEVLRLVDNAAGEDRFRARATNQETGKVCGGRVIFPS